MNLLVASRGFSAATPLALMVVPGICKHTTSHAGDAAPTQESCHTPI